MARPKSDDELRTEHFHMLLKLSEVEAIDEWRFANRVGSRAEAIRMLVQKALEQKVTK